MQIEILSISRKPTKWIKSAIDEYLDRFPAHMTPKLTYITPASGRVSKRQKTLMEAKAILSKVDKKDRLIVLDVSGDNLTNDLLMDKLDNFGALETKIKMIIGSSDGLDASVKRQASESWSLSSLVLPHKIVQILILEQLYRAYSISIGHPYHRS